MEKENIVVKLFKDNVLLITGLTIALMALGACANFLKKYGAIDSIISVVFASIVFYAFMQIAKKNK